MTIKIAENISLYFLTNNKIKMLVKKYTPY